MCGRYSLFTDEESRELMQIVQEIQNRYPNSGMKTGEIFPTNVAPVMIMENKKIIPQPQKWGFPNFARKGVVINARSETAQEKKMFHSSFINRRCVIPSTGFYEWSQDQEHQKYLFQIPEEKILYMAGIFHEFKGERCYVVLTAQANSSVDKIHNRMPVILRNTQLTRWMADIDYAVETIEGQLPALISHVVS